VDEDESDYSMDPSNLSVDIPQESGQSMNSTYEPSDVSLAAKLRRLSKQQEERLRRQN